MVRYALVIGIANYTTFTNLPKAVNDAQAIGQVLREQGRYDVQPLPGKLIESENCWQVAPDKKVTGKQLGQTLRTFLLEKAKGQEALIYFAGHGFEAPSLTGEPKGYLATSDCNKDGQNAILFDDFIALIGKSELGSLVVVLDCCYAGSLLERSFIRSSSPVFHSRLNYCLITASRASERAREDAEGGIFTKAVLQGLSQDRADEVTGEVSISRLFDGISRQLKGSGQEPIYIGGGSAITLVWYPPKNPVVTAVVSEECPYQGLQPFGKKQARFFFGREKVVQLLMEKLEQANFVPIIGASGSGKSSVVRAGLIPRLEKNGWRVLEPIKPDVEPLTELRGAFKQYFQQSRELYDYIHNHLDGLRSVIEQLPGLERLLLVVDQFEEVFTVCLKEEERHRFIELLTQVARIPASRLAIVTTMRADFLEPCLSYESLTQLIQDEAVYMPPLVGAELEEAIASPAKLQGYSFETGLLGEILRDVGQEKGCLPLLQFALTELWEERDQQAYQLRVAQYKQLDGVIGALNRHAEQIYESFTAQEQAWVKWFFLKLVRTGADAKDTRQRQPKSELLAIAKDNPANREAISRVLDRLVNGRLLVTDQEPEGEVWVDLAHEALMHGWERFAQWCQEDRERRRLISRIKDAYQEWWRHPQDENLMMGGLLTQAREQWSELEPELSPPVKKFYQQSDAHEQEQNAARQRADNVRREDEAILQKQANEVLSLLSTEPVKGLVLAIQTTGLSLEKLQGKVLSAVQHSLYQAVKVAREQNIFIIKDCKEPIRSVTFSPSGQYIVSGGNDGTVRLWDCKGQLICPPFQGHEDCVNSVAFSPDGQYIVSGGNDGTVRLWDCKGQLICPPFQGHEDCVNAVAFSPDGQYVVSGGNDGTVRLWGCKGRLIGTFQEHKDWVNSVAFSPNSPLIVSGSDDKTIGVWDIQSNRTGTFPVHTDAVRSVVFSPDGQYILSGSWDGTVQLWNLQGQSISDPFQGHEGWVNCVVFSPNGQYIVSGSGDGTIRLWNLQGQPIISNPFQGHEGWVSAVAVSPDGRCIISGGNDGTVRLWDCQNDLIGTSSQGNEGEVNFVSGESEGCWEQLLQVACQRLRYHPTFVNPETEETKAACTTCQQHV